MENLFDPVIRVDVENRCAVMLVYGRHLVVLPFKQENPVDDSDQLQMGFDFLFLLSLFSYSVRSIITINVFIVSLHIAKGS